MHRGTVKMCLHYTSSVFNFEFVISLESATQIVVCLCSLVAWVNYAVKTLTLHPMLLEVA